MGGAGVYVRGDLSEGGDDNVQRYPNLRGRNRGTGSQTLPSNLGLSSLHVFDLGHAGLLGRRLDDLLVGRLVRVGN